MYNPYNPYAYLYPNQGMQYTPNNMPTMPTNNTIPQNTAPQSNMPTVMQVSTIKQVEQAPVQPGGKALVLVSNEPVIAMRSADNMGITSTDYYHIEKFDPETEQTAPSVDYVTRAEFQQALANIAQQLQPTKEEKK